MCPATVRAVWRGVFLTALLSAGLHAASDAAPDPNQAELQSLVNGDSPSKKVLVLNPETTEARYHFAAGVSYTGAQLRYQFSPKWAAEYRYQYGKASSDYGDVKATVLGLRGYRFIPYRHSLSWYLGAEGDYASAKADNSDSNYSISGFVMGGFAGLEYRVLPRVAISADIGPYAIALKEKQSNLSQTNMDFIVNTAINFYIL